jgi:hypothetical protein
LPVADFRLNDACNILRRQVRKNALTPTEVRAGIRQLRAGVERLRWRGFATLYVAFAIAMSAHGVVVADGPFVRDMRTHS